MMSGSLLALCIATAALAAIPGPNVVLAGDLCWAGFASRARLVLSRYGRLKSRLAGGLLVTSGVGLALSRREP